MKSVFRKKWLVKQDIIDIIFLLTDIVVHVHDIDFNLMVQEKQINQWHSAIRHILIVNSQL